jgi:hypothetical protein
VAETTDQEVQSPLKQTEPVQTGAAAEVRGKGVAGIGKQLFGHGEEEVLISGQGKRKSKGTELTLMTLDLNIPLSSSNAIVPVGLVNARVQQMDGDVDNSGGSMIETLKKQKRGTTNQKAKSAGAASSSPRRAQ